jgi:hypothetical protein
MLSAAERETNTQIAAYQQGRTDAMRAPQHARQPQPAQRAPADTSGQGSGYPQGTQDLGYPQGTQGSQDPGYPQGSQGSGYPPGTDPGDWHDPGTNYR